MPLILRIALWACFFTMVFLSTTWLFNGCKSETAQALDEMTEVVEESTDDLVDDVEENVKELSDKFFEDDDEIIYTNEDEDDEGDDLADDLFREAETTTREVKKETVRERPADPPPVRSSAGGRYLVVAGNYLVETNAQEMVKKLKRMGFNGAQHLVFDQSQYYTVVASRSESRNGAQSSSENLKAKGVDNYVHTQRN